ncbi:uncharacterized protein LOC107417804 [Ziziphus jujuba]|uniref:Uncharacterized protein LOC107417804 n=2 Tax=Ziziphus jujuba TaxID=326968 RepID=A0A6P3ZQS1_ZIZJJ|nr:uncharacterized protein LOC107417804 [Ziziphus jujuba]KAH7528030.1 hypothetical protein FEM48_Zijuj05G0028500 [Ziziphus jujuba var. spinosa]
MSLVDYTSSDEDDDVPEDLPEKQENVSDQPPTPSPPPPLPNPLHKQKPSSESYQKPESSHSKEPPIEKLPDASLLLNSPDFSSNMVSATDHSSLVAAAMAENASRKRDSKGLASSLPRSKVPKGSLPHSKNVPDTVGGMLVPPQLSGRSNVVTEDISKLFVNKQADPSQQ